MEGAGGSEKGKEGRGCQVLYGGFAFSCVCVLVVLVGTDRNMNRSVKECQGVSRSVEASTAVQGVRGDQRVVGGVFQGSCLYRKRKSVGERWQAGSCGRDKGSESSAIGAGARAPADSKQLARLDGPACGGLRI